MQWLNVANAAAIKTTLADAAQDGWGAAPTASSAALSWYDHLTRLTYKVNLIGQPAKN